MPEPPKKAEVPGKQAISVPVTRPETPKPQPKPEEPPDPMMNIPAKTLGDTVQMNPGLLERHGSLDDLPGHGQRGWRRDRAGHRHRAGPWLGAGSRQLAEAPAAAFIAPATASSSRA